MMVIATCDSQSWGFYCNSCNQSGQLSKILIIKASRHPVGITEQYRKKREKELPPYTYLVIA